MAQAESVRTARRVSLWSAGFLVVATGVLLLAGLFVGWASAIALEGMLVVLFAPSVAMRYRLGKLGARQRALAIAVGLLMVWAWFWVFTGPLDYWFSTIGWGNRPFESGAWASAAGHDDPDPVHNPRGIMLRSLLRDHPLRGLSEAEVSGLLGCPDSTDPVSGVPVGRRETWNYFVGYYSGFRMDADFLSLTFRDGKVVTWRIWQS
jgi:hypothetical protein